MIYLIIVLFQLALLLMYYNLVFYILYVILNKGK